MKHLLKTFLLVFTVLLTTTVYAQKPYAGDGWIVDSIQKIQYQSKVVVIHNGTWQPTNEDLKFEISKADFTDKKKKTLALTVKYGGGCKIHRFQLIKPIQESKEKLQLYLVHESYNDLCKAYIANNMKFDTKQLKLNKKIKSVLINNYEIKL